jgi:hypothetical protein
LKTEQDSSKEMTVAGKNRIMIFGPTADGAYIVQSMSARREIKARAKVWRGAALVAALVFWVVVPGMKQQPV